MRRMTGAALGLAVVLSGCGGGRGAPDLEGMVTPLTLEPPPIYALLGSRSELNLTSEQVTALDSIAVAVQAANRPLIQALQDTHRGRTRQPGVFRVSPEGEPILEQIRENQRRASESVAEVLSEEQRESVCRIFERRPVGPRGRQLGPSSSALPDTALSRRAGRAGWYWCQPDGPDSDPAEATPAE